MTRFGWQGAAVLLALTAGCTPGYIKASQLEERGQGPAACAKSCEELGMRMAALVLVGNDLPGCVCQPLPVRGASDPQTASPPNAASSQFNDGAAASTTGYVVLAAAAAARQQQQAQQNQQNATKKN
jgi:hypothetical protein